MNSVRPVLSYVSCMTQNFLIVRTNLRLLTEEQIKKELARREETDNSNNNNDQSSQSDDKIEDRILGKR